MRHSNKLEWLKRWELLCKLNAGEALDDSDRAIMVRTLLMTHRLSAYGVDVDAMHDDLKKLHAGKYGPVLDRLEALNWRDGALDARAEIIATMKARKSLVVPMVRFFMRGGLRQTGAQRKAAEILDRDFVDVKSQYAAHKKNGRGEI